MADVQITVDGIPLVVPAGDNLLEACLSRGLAIPYFCWHPELGSVGACRQCAVVQYADADDQRGRLTMACMTSVAEGARFSVQADTAHHFRESVIEWLMTNHPHDCPVCEEGGECHLQDMTVLTGHTARRYRGRKRTFENQYLGPFINHEMNRCITCYRCVRFYRDYAGGSDLDAFGSRARMYFGRASDGVLENPFSGNLVEVCPTGVFTDKPFSRTYTRKWDLTSAPSICSGCATGCNTFVAERYGEFRRIHNRYHGTLNGYFLCDRGRFGSGWLSTDERIRQAGRKVSDDLFEPLDRDAGLATFAELVRAGGLVGIGSPRASIETNWALRLLVGNDNFCGGASELDARLTDQALDVYGTDGVNVANIRDIEQADAVLVLGEDLVATAPRLALALRQTVRNAAFELAERAGIPAWQDAGVRSHGREVLTPLFLATVLPDWLDDVATATCNAAPEAIAAAGAQIAAALDGQAPESPFAAAAAEALGAASRPLVIAGTGCAEPAILDAAAAVLDSLVRRGQSPWASMVVPEANSMGGALLGGGLALGEALDLAAGRTLVVVENDLFRRAGHAQVRDALSGAARVVVLDTVDTPTATLADLVFPTAAHAESTGTLVNLETRAQRFYSAFPPAGDVAPAWRWLADAAAAAGRNDLNYAHVDELLSAAARAPGLEALAGLLVPTDPAAVKVPRQPHRYSGRTAMNANRSVHEPRTASDTETPLGWSMEGQREADSGALLAYSWAPGWNSNQSIYRYQESVGGALKGGDPGVRLSAAVAARQRRTRTPPKAAAPQPGYRLIPLHAPFGAEELSARAPAVAERSAPPFLVLNPADAQTLELAQGRGVRCAGIDATLELRLDPAMEPGHAGVSVGIGGIGVLPGAPAQISADPQLVARS